MEGKVCLVQGKLKEVIEILNNVEMQKTVLSYEEVLKKLIFFGNKKIEALLETTPSEIEMVNLIETSSEIILDEYDRLSDYDKKHIMCSDIGKVLMKELKNKFRSWFDLVEEVLPQIEAFEKYTKMIDSLTNQIKKNISARLSTEEEATQLKNKISQRIEKMIEEIKTKNFNAEREIKLYKMLSSAEKECHELVDVKLKEEPVRLYYYRTGSRVSVKVNINRNGYSFHVGRGNKVRRNRQEDHEDYPYIVSVNYIDDFLDVNDVREQDVWIDPRSVDVFYGFLDKVSVNLTSSFVDDWYNHDCPELYRYEVNKEREINYFGFVLNHFSTLLVNAGWMSVDVDESITEEEAKKLIKGFEHTRISKQIQNVLKAQKLKEENEEKIEELESYVKEVDAKIQAVIDEYAPLILEKIADKFGVVKHADGEITINDKKFGLDCGWLNIFTTNEKYTSIRNMLNVLNSSIPKWMELKLPYPSYSTTVLKEQFNMFKDIVYEKTGFELYAVTQLD